MNEPDFRNVWAAEAIKQHREVTGTRAAEVLGAHQTTLVRCGGRIAGYECTCGYASDHGWTEDGAAIRARLHQAAYLADAGLLADMSELRDAVRDPGPHPDYHRSVMERHRREWPTLWQAIDRLISHN